MFEFSESRGRFYPGFCEAKEIRMMRVELGYFFIRRPK